MSWVGGEGWGDQDGTVAYLGSSPQRLNACNCSHLLLSRTFLVFRMQHYNCTSMSCIANLNGNSAEGCKSDDNQSNSSDQL